MTVPAPPADPTVGSEVRDLLHQQHVAMVAADVDRLAGILDNSFVAVHITGQEQSRADWLAQIASGRMRYHGVVEESVLVTVEGDHARVVSRAQVDATIWGARGTWPLESVTDYARLDGGWRVVRSSSTTF